MTTRTATRSSPADGPTRMRLAGAMTVSLLVHGLIISLQFGVPGIGLPALELPWRARRAQAVDLNVVLAPSPPGAVEMAPSPTPAPATESAPSVGLRIVPVPPAAAPKARKKSGTNKPAQARPPRPRVKRETPVIALNDARDSQFNMPAPTIDEAPPRPEPQVSAPVQPEAVPEPAAIPEDDSAVREREQLALRRAEEESAMRAREAEEQARRQQQQQAEAARAQEDARQHALAQEAERLALEQEEREKAEEANRRAAALALQQQREETLRREREEAARRAMELEEKQRAEAQRLQAERMQREAAELQARKQAEAAEAARQQAAARERERQAEEFAARRKAEAAAEAAGASRRERDPELALGDSPAPGARIDALPRGVPGGLAGRALEQARRGDALRNDGPAIRQSETAAGQPRRHSILGGKDVDVGVMMYVEGWRLKIERNGSIMYPRAAVDKAQGDPVVTVAVRSDGSVEGVVIHRSSGRAELDEAVHRIVRVNARYSVFPPELARRFDVIEIRKVWNFEDRLRILEEVR